MYAAYNTALGYEMQDSIDTALEWALKAQTLAREKSKTDKKETGEIHDGTISYYIFISMYVDELIGETKRGNGTPEHANEQI